MNEQQFERQRIAVTRTTADAHTALWIAVVRQALRDATGGAPRHTLCYPADKRLAAGAAPWLDDWLPGWRRVAG
jgi:hypothetical protein